MRCDREKATSRSQKCAVIAAVGLASFAPALRSQSSPAGADGKSEVGEVYYIRGSETVPLHKVVAAVSGRVNYSAKIKGANADLRLAPGQSYTFRVCGVDPTRYKLYRMKSEKNERLVVISKANIWIGGARQVLPESEVAVHIQSAENSCFTLTPEQPLADGEYGFSPFESNDVYPFGVGPANPHK